MAPKKQAPKTAANQSSDNTDKDNTDMPVWDTSDTTLAEHLENLYEWLPTAHPEFNDLVVHRKVT